MKIDPERDYRIYIYAYDRRELPLYLVHGQEKDRELGTFLLEMTQMER